MSALLKNLATIHGLKSTDVVELIRKRMREFVELKKANTVAGFMKWLWDKDCVDYTVIDKFLTDKEIGTEFSRLYPKNTSYRKVLK